MVHSAEARALLKKHVAHTFLPSNTSPKLECILQRDSFFRTMPTCGAEIALTQQWRLLGNIEEVSVMRRCVLRWRAQQSGVVT